MTKRETFGERLQRLREVAGITQQGLADVTGVSLGSIRNYEQNHRAPLWGAFLALAKAIGVSAEAFADCEGAISPPQDKPKKPRKKQGGG